MKLNDQKKWAFIPFANLVIIFISICKNARSFKKMWQFNLLAHVIVCVVPVFIVSTILFELFDLNSNIANFIVFYILSLIASIVMIYWQKKNGGTDQ